MRESSANSLVCKILPLTRCSSRINLGFLTNMRIPIDRGERGTTRRAVQFPFWKSSRVAVAAFLLLSSVSFADALRGTLVHEATLRVAPDGDAAKLSQIDRGHELVVIETSRDWLHVQVIIMQARATDDDEENEPKTI